jgi:putative ABC transport system substrate-binding protein
MRIRRRDFITLLGGAAAWPLAARAQQSAERMRVIGALIGGAEVDAERQRWAAEFREALAKLGWIEGRTVRIEWRWAAGDNGRAAAYAAELAGLRPDALFGDNTFVVMELQKATRSLPIVFAKVNDPFSFGLADSLARPGGNITGFADAEPASLTKLPELLKQLAPQLESVAIILGQGPTPRSQGIANAASSIGMRASLHLLHDAREIEEAITGFARGPNVGLIHPGDPVILPYRGLVVKLAAQYRLPAAYGNPIWGPEGGLLCYGTKAEDQYRGAAGYINRILKGARPDELPIQTPTKYQLVINMKTAKALGLTVPPTLLSTADEVIE